MNGHGLSTLSWREHDGRHSSQPCFEHPCAGALPVIGGPSNRIIVLLDQVDPDVATITALLDAIPGAWERAQSGLADAEAGRVVCLDEL